MFHSCSGWGGTRWGRHYAYAAYHQDPAPKHRQSFYESRHYGRRSGFGVRRPLRYLAYQLDLDEGQMRRVAAVLDALKTEREQAKLDQARTLTGVADLVNKADALSMDELLESLAPRVSSAERLQTAVARAVHDIVEVLDADQRAEFAYLLNSKTFTL